MADDTSLRRTWNSAKTSSARRIRRSGVAPQFASQVAFSISESSNRVLPDFFLSGAAVCLYQSLHASPLDWHQTGMKPVAMATAAARIAEYSRLSTLSFVHTSGLMHLDLPSSPGPMLLNLALSLFYFWTYAALERKQKESLYGAAI
eukprot:CAMPEP_0174309126 /NCGR_PEP_ID=MMETSP0810-20121108/2199_1 /TAXON_ID=73025 ORGANISM="Eutreptiella gymnastica-like, Strain CCMP1594" /NCGR_SAMPLE_ID=MMETSP0810 /ASSEMBLY_ACC=CAM_ASM_000659 /LENGTH=146 /DNA_ID=CAMNT_0015416649 /DNA_START=1195 /DNA_END=1635 /DNA_ORIENTATION=+